MLSRQRDETIMIGDEIQITVVDVRGDKVRLGISAPARIAVHRKEVYEAIRAENEQAAAITAAALPTVGASPSGTRDLSPGPQKRTGLLRPTGTDGPPVVPRTAPGATHMRIVTVALAK